MEKILKLYETVKNIKGIDMFLIDSYIKVILQKFECETIEELVESVRAKEKEATELHNYSSELNEKLRKIMEEERSLLSHLIDLRNEATYKCTTRVLLPILGVMGVGASCVVIFFNIPSLLLSLVSLFAASRIGLSVRDKIWSEYGVNKARYEELNGQESLLSNEFNQKLFEALSLNNSINELVKTVGDITTFLETYISVTEKVDPESLIQYSALEEHGEVNEAISEVVSEEVKERRL